MGRRDRALAGRRRGDDRGGGRGRVDAPAHPDRPGIALSDDDREIVRVSQEQAFADPSIEAVRAAHPHGIRSTWS